MNAHIYAAHRLQRTGPSSTTGGADSPSSSRANGVTTRLNGTADSFNISGDSGTLFKNLKKFIKY